MNNSMHRWLVVYAGRTVLDTCFTSNEIFKTRSSAMRRMREVRKLFGVKRHGKLTGYFLPVTIREISISELVNEPH